MRWFVYASVLGAVIGCGAAPVDKPVAAPKAMPATVKPAAVEPRPPIATPETVAVDAFANPDEAVKAFAQAVSESNSAEYARAQSWLLLQKEAAIPSVVRLVRDEQAPQVARTNGCKMLAQLGPEAVAPLLDLGQTGVPRIQHVAIEQLGNVRPTSQQIIARLIELTQGADTDVRLAAILGLEHIDPPATEAADAMLAILNNTSEPESLRSAAKQCLTKVNPRKTFND